MSTHPRLVGVADFARDNLGTVLEENLVGFLRWGLVNAGAFVEVPVRTPGTPDPYGDETLYPVDRDGVAPGRIWEARNPDWCYEVGLDASPGPTVASGVYVNGTFHATASTTGPYAHALDFPHGRATFTTPLPPSSVVQVAHAYRRVAVFRPDRPWFRPVVLGQFGVGQSEQLDRAGVIQRLTDDRVRVPLVCVQALVERSSYGYGLGLGMDIQRRPVLFHLLADSPDDLKNLADAISFQKQSTIRLYDTNGPRLAGVSTLDFAGMPVPSGPQYPDLLDAYPLAHAFFASCSGSDVSAALPLFRGIVRAEIEVLSAGV